MTKRGALRPSPAHLWLWRRELIQPARLDECARELSKALKIAQAVFREVVEQRIQIRHAVFENGDSPTVQSLRPIEIEYRAPTDDRIQGHQLPFVRAGKVRPALATMGFPQ